jgi:uncharacterized protein
MRRSRRGFCRPLISANIWQAFEGGGTGREIRRLWPIIVALAVGTSTGASLLIGMNRHWLDTLLGISLVLIAELILCQPRIRLNRSAERWGGPLIGLSAGLPGGIPGMHGPRLIAYLVGLDLIPDLFTKQISILFLAVAATLLLALGGVGSLSLTEPLLSAVGIVPIHLGLMIGRRLRRQIRPVRFSRRRSLGDGRERYRPDVPSTSLVLL